MKSFFNQDFFSNNRRRLRELCDTAYPIVITANGLVQRGADSGFPFAQDANFWYLTGITEADVLLVMHGTEEYLIVPERDERRAAFDGAVDDTALIDRSGVRTILGTDAGWKKLSKSLVDQVTTIASPPAYIEHYGMYVNPARLTLINRLEQLSVEITDASRHMATLRVIKQPMELRAIQQAIDTTIDSLLKVSERATAGEYSAEYEVEADITRDFRRSGATGHAFEPIVAGGANACTLHNVANNDELVSGQLLTLDIGAEHEQYAADITRTIARSIPSDRQQAVYDAVLETQEFGFTLMKPGAYMKDIEAEIEAMIGDKLTKLGLIKKTSHEAIRHYYPHSVSHFMGLNVHDVGNYAEPLQPGMVLTVEPGIYIPEEGIGVRIEDDVCITEDGCTVLTKRLPRVLYQP